MSRPQRRGDKLSSRAQLCDYQHRERPAGQRSLATSKCQHCRSVLQLAGVVVAVVGRVRGRWHAGEARRTRALAAHCRGPAESRAHRYQWFAHVSYSGDSRRDVAGGGRRPARASRSSAFDAGVRHHRTGVLDLLVGAAGARSTASLARMWLDRGTATSGASWLHLAAGDAGHAICVVVTGVAAGCIASST